MSEPAGPARGAWPPFAAAATAEVVVPYADTDAQGRVYYGRYTRYLDAARLLVWSAAGFDEAALRRLEHATVTVRLELEYRSAAGFHDRLLVDAGIERLGRTSLVFRYAVRLVDGRPVLDARQVSVQVDFAGDARPLPWSGPDRARLAGLVGGR